MGKHISTTENESITEHDTLQLSDTFYLEEEPMETKIIGGGWVAVPSENVLQVMNPALEGLRNKDEMLKPTIEGLRTIGDKENEPMVEIVGIPLSEHNEEMKKKNERIAYLERKVERVEKSFKDTSKLLEERLREAEDRTERDERELRQFKAERRGQYALEVYRTVNASQNYTKQAEDLTEAAVNVIIEQLKVEPELTVTNPIIGKPIVGKDEPEECCEESAIDSPVPELSDYQEELIKKVRGTRFSKMGQKTTICVLILHNGFEIVGTSACVNPEDYSRSLGEHYALEDALRKLDGYIGFERQSKQSVE